MQTVPVKAKQFSETKAKQPKPVRSKPTQVPAYRQRPSVNLGGLFQGLRESQAPMQTSKQGVSYRYLVPPADPNEDPGFLRPPTQQDVEYGERLRRAQRLKESGERPSGRDPVKVEQRITAAERQNPYWRDRGDSLRETMYGEGLIKGAVHNVGDLLADGYKGSLGQIAPFAFLPGGSIYKAGWGHDPSRRFDTMGWSRHRLLSGEGTGPDQGRAWQRKLDTYEHKYYGQPDPGPRPRNVYDDLAMPQPKYPISRVVDFGQDDVPLYLTDVGQAIERDHGPYKVPPPGAETGLPAGALQSHGLSTRPFFTNEQKAMLQKHSMEKLSPQLQDYVKRLSSEPEQAPMIDLSGGKEGEGEGEKKETFNLLKFLLGLLGLPLKLLGLDGFGEDEDEGKGKKRGKSPYGRQRPPLPSGQMQTRTYGPANRQGGQMR